MLLIYRMIITFFQYWVVSGKIFCKCWAAFKPLSLVLQTPSFTVTYNAPAPSSNFTPFLSYKHTHTQCICQSWSLGVAQRKRDHYRNVVLQPKLVSQAVFFLEKHQKLTENWTKKFLPEMHNNGIPSCHCSPMKVV